MNLFFKTFSKILCSLCKKAPFFSLRLLQNWSFTQVNSQFFSCASLKNEAFFIRDRVFLQALCIVFSLVVASCSFNRAIFDTGIVGEPLPDTVKLRDIYYENFDGVKIHANLFYTQEKVKGSVFLLKGQSGDIKLWYDAIEVMLRNGFHVFTFDYEGFGNSEGKPSHKNLLDDSQLLLEEFGRIDDIKNTKKILWGFSVGANLAVKLAYENQGVFDYIILDSPYTSQRSTSLKLVPILVKPIALITAKSSYSSKKLIGNINGTPILIVHSIEDQQSPYTEGEILFKLAKKPKLFFESLGPHCYSLIDYEKLYIERVNKLLRY